MEKIFKSGDKVFLIRLKQYGIFISYLKSSDDEAIVEFVDQYGCEDVKVFSLCFLQKVETKEVEIKENKVHYEVFYKVYINNQKMLERVKKEIFDTKSKAIKYLKIKKYESGANWIEGNIIEVELREIFRL